MHSELRAPALGTWQSTMLRSEIRAIHPGTTWGVIEKELLTVIVLWLFDTKDLLLVGCYGQES
jgi:hypothetical protein